jgi:hypothetical protein
MVKFYTRTEMVRSGCQCQKEYMQSWHEYLQLQDNNHNGECTYLNSGLFVAPCKYVLHGLVPGMY